MGYRRQYLKSVAKLTTGVGVLAGAEGAGASKAVAQTGDFLTKPQKEWGDSLRYEFDYPTDFEATASLHWYSSTWLESQGWIHDFGYCTTAAARKRYDDDGSMAISKQRSLFEVVDNDRQGVDPIETSKYCGAYPNSSSDVLPDWVEIPAKTALGLYSPYMAFAIGAAEMNEALAPEDGYSYYDGSYSYTHSPPWWAMNDWTDAAQFQRFQYSSQTDGTIGRDFWVETRTDTSTHYFELQFDISVWKDDPPRGSRDTDDLLLSGSTTSTSTARSDDISKLAALDFDPREMSDSQKQKFGITEVSPKSSNLEILSGASDEKAFVATDLPMAIETSKTVERKSD